MNLDSYIDRLDTTQAVLKIIMYNLCYYGYKAKPGTAYSLYKIYDMYGLTNIVFRMIKHCNNYFLWKEIETSFNKCVNNLLEKPKL